MTISANSLFHFTNNIESIKGILEDNFRIYFCRETIMMESIPVTYYVPMVSFCDLALSEIKDHIKSYGEYGIGLTKDWAVKNGLNPVMYISSGSQLAKNIKKSSNHFARGKLIEMTDEQLGLIELKRYIKNYEGNLTRSGVNHGKYRFYNEREWRFTPDKNVYPKLISTEKFYKENKSDCDEKIEKARLYFEPSDIKYIIIKDESEIAHVIDHLRRVKGKRYSLDEIEKLTTRILTSEQILNDI